MKTLRLALILLAALAVNSLAGGEYFTQNLSELPAPAQALLSEHFKDLKLAIIKVDEELFSKSFDVKYQDGTEVEFDKKGNLTEVKVPSGEVPAALIPQEIKAMAESMYPGQKIVKFEKDDDGEYEVELANRAELKFDKKLRLRKYK